MLMLYAPSRSVQIAAGGAGGNPTFAALQGADKAWTKVKAQKVMNIMKQQHPCHELSNSAKQGRLETLKARLMTGLYSRSVLFLQKQGPHGSVPDFVQNITAPLSLAVQYDVIMCGGTLGIFLACSLQQKGLK